MLKVCLRGLVWHTIQFSGLAGQPGIRSEKTANREIQRKRKKERQRKGEQSSELAEQVEQDFTKII